jgi:hypothetical protein
MRELDVSKDNKDVIEIVKQQVKEIQLVLDNTIRPQKNHTLFEINLKDKTITTAVFEKEPN